MSAILLRTGAVWLDEGFVADSHGLYSALVSGIVWDERMRARKAASFGLPYNYSGIVWPEAPFPALLSALLDRLAARLGYRPNNCLAHYYPDGGSTMGFHSDDTAGLIAGTGIAIVSLGAERTLTFRKMDQRSVTEGHRLRSGSLFYMCPEMQVAWQHAVLAEKGTVGGRVSLTFRAIEPSHLDG
jgi:alkylated DNA repair dioxygenase AlkB